MIISGQGKELEMTNASRGDTLIELKEKVDDIASIQTRLEEEATLEQADLSQQILELQNQIISGNTALHNMEIQEEKMAELFGNCKGIEF